MDANIGTEVGIGPGDIVLDGNPAPHDKRHNSPFPTFRTPCLLWPSGRQSQQLLTAELLLH